MYKRHVFAFKRDIQKYRPPCRNRRIDVKKGENIGSGKDDIIKSSQVDARKVSIFLFINALFFSFLK